MASQQSANKKRKAGDGVDDDDEDDNNQLADHEQPTQKRPRSSSLLFDPLFNVYAYIGTAITLNDPIEIMPVLVRVFDDLRDRVLKPQAFSNILTDVLLSLLRTALSKATTSPDQLVSGDGRRWLEIATLIVNESNLEANDVFLVREDGTTVFWWAAAYCHVFPLLLERMFHFRNSVTLSHLRVESNRESDNRGTTAFWWLAMHANQDVAKRYLDVILVSSGIKLTLSDYQAKAESGPYMGTTVLQLAEKHRVVYPPLLKVVSDMQPFSLEQSGQNSCVASPQGIASEHRQSTNSSPPSLVAENAEGQDALTPFVAVAPILNRDDIGDYGVGRINTELNDIRDNEQSQMVTPTDRSGSASHPETTKESSDYGPLMTSQMSVSQPIHPVGSNPGNDMDSCADDNCINTNNCDSGKVNSLPLPGDDKRCETRIIKHANPSMEQKSEWLKTYAGHDSVLQELISGARCVLSLLVNDKELGIAVLKTFCDPTTQLHRLLDQHDIITVDRLLSHRMDDLCPLLGDLLGKALGREKSWGIKFIDIQDRKLIRKTREGSFRSGNIWVPSHSPMALPAEQYPKFILDQRDNLGQQATTQPDCPTLPGNELFKGTTPLWWAARTASTFPCLLEVALDRFRDTLTLEDVLAKDETTDGDDSGTSVLWWLVYYVDSGVVKKFLDFVLDRLADQPDPGLTVDHFRVSPKNDGHQREIDGLNCGLYDGITVLWLVAGHASHYPRILQFVLSDLSRHLELRDILTKATGTDHDEFGLTVLWWVAHNSNTKVTCDFLNFEWARFSDELTLYDIKAVPIHGPRVGYTVLTLMAIHANHVGGPLKSILKKFGAELAQDDSMITPTPDGTSILWWAAAHAHNCPDLLEFILKHFGTKLTMDHLRATCPFITRFLRTTTLWWIAYRLDTQIARDFFNSVWATFSDELTLDDINVGPSDGSCVGYTVLTSMAIHANHVGGPLKSILKKFGAELAQNDSMITPTPKGTSILWWAAFHADDCPDLLEFILKHFGTKLTMDHLRVTDPHKHPKTTALWWIAYHLDTQIAYDFFDFVWARFSDELTLDDINVASRNAPCQGYTVLTHIAIRADRVGGPLKSILRKFGAELAQNDSMITSTPDGTSTVIVEMFGKEILLLLWRKCLG